MSSASAIPKTFPGPLLFDPLNPPISVKFSVSFKRICLKAAMIHAGANQAASNPNSFGFTANQSYANRAAVSVGFPVKWKPVKEKSKSVMAATLEGNELNRSDSQCPLGLIVLKWMAKKVCHYVLANKKKVTSDMKTFTLSVLRESSDAALTFVYTVTLFVLLFLLVPGTLNHVYYGLKVIREKQTGSADMEKLVKEHKRPLLFEGYEMTKLLVDVLGHLVGWVLGQ